MLESIAYMVDLTGFQSVQVDYTNSACGTALCEANLNNIESSGIDGQHELTLSVKNTTHPLSGLSYETVKHVGKFHFS